MSNILSTIGKLLSSAGKGYAKNTAKKRENEDKKDTAKEQKAQKS